MKEIENISLRDFRIHKRLDVDLSSPVTTIIGSSYKGKSTIIRALRWVLLNKPPGISMIRWWAKKASVRVKVDGHEIKRVRSKTLNLYKLDGCKLSAFGNDVPEPIAKLSNLSPINFQGQHDMPFWFGETAGGVSRQLNAIVDLDVIDRSLSNLAKRLTETRAAVSITKDRLEEAQQIKKDLAYVVKMGDEFEQIKTVEAEKDRIEECIERLEGIVKQLQKLNETKSRLRPLVKEGRKDLSKLHSLYISHRDIRKNLMHLIGHKRKLTDLMDIKEQAKKNLVQLEGKLKAMKRCPLCGSSLKQNTKM